MVQCAARAAIGPHEIFIDSVQSVDAAGNVLTIYNFDDGTNFQAGRRRALVAARPPPPGIAQPNGRRSRRGATAATAAASVTLPDNTTSRRAALP